MDGAAADNMWEMMWVTVDDVVLGGVDSSVCASLVKRQHLDQEVWNTNPPRHNCLPKLYHK
jgi:hypothetical protein